MSRCLPIAVLLALCSASPTGAEEPLPPIPPIARLLPPAGVKLPEEEQAKLEERLAAIEKRLAPLRQDRLSPDIEIFTKAVRYAIDLHEFYDAKKDVAKAHKLLDEAERRVTFLEEHRSPWTTEVGLVVRGYRSSIDGSAQPYGVVFPEGTRESLRTDETDTERIGLYRTIVFLHGRGDKSTDLHFIYERMTQPGPLGRIDAVVMHPFGRQCVGFKSAGEIDVLEAWQHFALEIKLNEWSCQFLRPILMGFSMGGAGAWHIGGHYSDQFIAVSPGAGFAETAEYTRTDPASVPWYERRLWGCYDVPNYTRNFRNLAVIAYSGENDKQIQAARVMERAFVAEDQQLDHRIGPGMEHRYEAQTLKNLLADLTETADSYKPWKLPADISLQTRTLRYSRAFRLQAWRLEKHWDDARIDRQHRTDGAKFVHVINTKNIAAFRADVASNVIIDGSEIKDVRPTPESWEDGESDSDGKLRWVRFEKQDGKWQRVDRFAEGLHKVPGLQGPIDDAFLSPFLIVEPSGECSHPAVQRWTDFELARFKDRWRALMRGEPRIKQDKDVTPQDIAAFHLVCFGDTASNSVIREAAGKLPLRWREDRIEAGDHSWPAASHVPCLIYPNPLAAPLRDRKGERIPRYLVINSGLTFREAHDKTNSQQNPKLPDWAVIDLSQLPDDKAPGRIAAAGFFDEEWKWQEPGE